VTRLVVVSPTNALSAGMSAAGYQVVHVWPDAFEVWLGAHADVDAFVLDLGGAGLALTRVVQLRHRVALVPVFLVASDQPGWDTAVLHDLSATRVVPHSADNAALLAALQAFGVEPTAAPRRRADAVSEAMSELTRDRHGLLSEDDDLDSLITAVPPLEPEPADRLRHARGERSK
jgi:hypothetical protein